MKIFVHTLNTKDDDAVATIIEPVVVELMPDQTLKAWVADGCFCILKNILAYPEYIKDTVPQIADKLFQTDKAVVIAEIEWDSDEDDEDEEE